MMAEPGADEKICNGCGELKKLIEFAKHCRSRDGHKSTCKECIKKKYIENAEEIKAKSKERYWKNPEKYREQVRNYQRGNPERERERRRRYVQKNRDKVRERMREYFKKNPDKHRQRYTKYPEHSKARMLLSHAIRRGEIKREPCFVCGNPKSEGHHEDYSKPLDVVWLCRKHHSERHIEIRERSKK